jgi:hypothetical protein
MQFPDITAIDPSSNALRMAEKKDTITVIGGFRLLSCVDEGDRLWV